MDNPFKIAGYVYCITNTINGKQYVGCTKSLPTIRWGRHKVDAKRGGNTYLHRAIRKYGAEVFLVDSLFLVFGSRDDLIREEERFIHEMETLAPGGYNLVSKGGVGPDWFDDGFRDRHRKAIRKATVQNPDWVEKNKVIVESRLNSPEAQYAAKEALKERWRTDIQFREEKLQDLKKLHKSSAWIESNRKGLLKREANRALRDSSFDPKELERRKKNRERMRRSVEKRRALAEGREWVPHEHGNTTAAKLRDLDRDPQEVERRKRLREADKRYRTKKRKSKEM